MSAKYISAGSAALSLLAIVGLALGNPRVGGTDSDGGRSAPFYGDDTPDGGDNGGNDHPVSDDTIIANQQIYGMREEIALQASWLGPGPNDLNLIMAGGDWLGQIRRAQHALQDLSSRERRAIFGLKGKSGRGKPGRGKAAAGPASVIPPTYVGGDDGGDEAHVVVNLWQTYVTPDGRKARVPYTFSDDVIAAWQDRANPDQSAEDQNAVAGVANTLAVMLLLEQYLPVRFEGYNPDYDAGSQILLVASAGTGIFTDDNGAGVIVANQVSRIGRARQLNVDDTVDPTTMTHCTWSNFPSMIRSFGFVLGLDWEQRHPDRDTYIIVHPENIPPYNFPPPLTPNDGSFTQGLTITGRDNDPLAGADLGPVLFDIDASNTFMEDAGCTFDLDSMMLIDPYIIATVLSAYTVRDDYRFDDLNGDSILDLTPGGPDDRVVNPPIPLFLSDCDIAQLTATYTREPEWYFGDDVECPFDINADEIQDGRDAALFIQRYLAQDISADLVPPYHSVDPLDLDYFNTTFAIQSCVGPADPPLPDDAPWFLGDDPECQFDLNHDQVQNGEDALLYLTMYQTGDDRADITQPWGEIDEADLEFFNANFAVQTCVNEGVDPALSPSTPWFYGFNPDCPHDINKDTVLDGTDAGLFTQFTDFPDFVNTDPRGDIVRPFGVVDLADYNAFFNGQAPSITAFAFGPCDNNTGENGWYYGRNPDCPYDINDDGVQNYLDSELYLGFYNTGDTRADLVPTYGVVDALDLQAFSRGDDANNIVAFQLQSCVPESPDDGTAWYYGKNPNCPHDVSQNGIQDSQDVALFMDLWENQDPRADIFPDYGVINLSDLQVFILGDDDGLFPHIPNGDQTSPRPPFIPGYCGFDGLPNQGNRPDRVNPP
ncbi:MAG: hypothetical protein H6810_03435 [Phycisphaeraceae bacterium]|nr:MAG: hypothetical protein H6810_03435 [Phycisphaeraceae bacterium]